jgi:hypothetical protein
LFQISLENFFKTKTYLLYHLRLQPSEVEKLPFYEYEYIVQNLIDILKEKQEAEENQHKSHSDVSPSSLMRDAGKSMPKMPSMSSYSPTNFPGIPSSLKL